MPSNHPKLPRVHQSIAAKLTCFEQKPRHFRVLGTARVAIRLQSKERWLPHRCSRAFGSRVLSLWTSWNLVCTHHWCCCYDPGDHEPLLWMAKHLRHHDLSDLEKWRFDLDDKGPQKQNMSKLSNTQRKLIRKWSISLILPPKNHKKKTLYSRVSSFFCHSLLLQILFFKKKSTQQQKMPTKVLAKKPVASAQSRAVRAKTCRAITGFYSLPFTAIAEPCSLVGNPRQHPG